MDITIRELINEELKRQREGIELIASENFASAEVIRTMGTVLTNKYAEGYPGKRYYGGCEVVDKVEQTAIDRLKNLFGATFANVQPHSGSQANTAVYLACLKPGDTILGLDLAHGGHLTHGSPVSYSGKTYKAEFYQVDPDTKTIDMDAVERKAKEVNPKLIICGASAYSRDWDYARFRAIADSVGALLMADIAHPAGLIAAKKLNDPIPHCHFVTSTTHKTLRGPRGGIVIMGKDFDNPWGKTTSKGDPVRMSNMINSAVFPGIQGGPLEHIIAAKAVAFHEAMQPAFRDYAGKVISNARQFANDLQSLGYEIVSGGTDNHLMLIDLRSKNITGKEAENALIKANITVNKNMVPFDNKSAAVTSGIRIGAAAVTSRGLGESDCTQVIQLIDEALMNKDNDSALANVRTKVKALMDKFPLYKGEF